MKGLVARGLITCVAAWLFLLGPRSAADDAGVRPAVARRSPALPPKPLPLPPLNERAALATAHREGNGWVSQDASGRRIELTLVPALQERAQRLFRDYEVPYAALVALDPVSGRVLAYVNHSSAEATGTRDLACDVSAPAASVFKLVTLSALIDAGVAPSTRVCYGGGSSRLEAVDLRDNPKRDRMCATLDDALGKSINAIFAKLADRHLEAATLLRYARAFGFGHALPFKFTPPAGPIEVPGDRLEFARTAAGFWHAFMSPLQAALIAATFANEGAMPQPWLIDRVLLPDGTPAPLVRQAAGATRRVIPAATARSVARMMQRTVRDGTSRAAFSDARGRSQLPGITVAGKTGSLSANDPFRAYSWWVGFAPAEQPRIALATLVVNGPKWRIKSSLVARELLREFLVLRPTGERGELAHAP